MSANQNFQKGGASQLTLDVLGQLFDRKALQNVSFRLWDGTMWPDDVPRPTTIVLNHPGALRNVFRDTHTDLSFGEAYIYDDFDIEGEIDSIFPLAEYLLAQKLGLAQRLNLGVKLLQLPGGRKTETDARQAARNRSPSFTRAGSPGHCLPLRYIQ
jgi:cyclopropane-fatty-acyl-phospholipid synthase